MKGKHETTRSVLRGFRRDSTIASAFAGLDKAPKEATPIHELSKKPIQEILQQALDALVLQESFVDGYYMPMPTVLEAKDAIRAALAEPGSTLVGYMRPDELQKAKKAPFLCRVHPPKDKHSDMVPVYVGARHQT